jgi:hypothetical protein
MSRAATYLTSEEQARSHIDRMLKPAGWVAQNPGAVNPAATRDVATRELVLKAERGRADCLLFVGREADPGERSR